MFSPSDNMRLQKDQAALGSLQEDYDKGILTDDEFQQLHSQIAPRIQMGQQAQQQSVMEQMQQQNTLTAHQNAFQQSLAQQDAAFQASNAHSQLATFVDPLNPDRTAHYFFNKKGEAEKVEWDGGKGSDPSSEEQSLDYFSPTLGMVPGQAPERPDELAATEQPTEPQPRPIPSIPKDLGFAPEDQHTMTVNMGDQSYQAKFGQGPEGWRQVGQQHFNQQTGQWEDMPIGSAMGTTQQQGAEKQGPGEISQAELAKIGVKAQFAARSLGLRPGTPEFNHYVAATAQELTKREISRRSIAEEHQRQETAKSQEARQREKASAERQAAEVQARKEKAAEDLKNKRAAALGQHYSTRLHQLENMAQARLKEIENSGLPQTDEKGPSKEKLRAALPKYLTDEAEMRKQARKDAQDTVDLMHPQEEKPKAEQPKETAGGDSTTQKFDDYFGKMFSAAHANRDADAAFAVKDLQNWIKQYGSFEKMPPEIKPKAIKAREILNKYQGGPKLPEAPTGLPDYMKAPAFPGA